LFHIPVQTPFASSRSRIKCGIDSGGEPGTVPAEAGIQILCFGWIPACAGMTEYVLHLVV